MNTFVFLSKILNAGLLLVTEYFYTAVVTFTLLPLLDATVQVVVSQLGGIITLEVLSSKMSLIILKNVKWTAPTTASVSNPTDGLVFSISFTAGLVFCPPELSFCGSKNVDVIFLHSWWMIEVVVNKALKCISLTEPSNRLHSQSRLNMRLVR